MRIFDETYWPENAFDIMNPKIDNKASKSLSLSQRLFCSDRPYISTLVHLIEALQSTYLIPGDYRLGIPIGIKNLVGRTSYALLETLTQTFEIKVFDGMKETRIIIDCKWLQTSAPGPFIRARVVFQVHIVSNCEVRKLHWRYESYYAFGSYAFI